MTRSLQSCTSRKTLRLTCSSSLNASCTMSTFSEAAYVSWRPAIASQLFQDALLVRSMGGLMLGLRMLITWSPVGPTVRGAISLTICGARLSKK